MEAILQTILSAGKDILPYYEEFMPPAIFFAGFFIAFSLIELILIFILNRLGSSHWEFMIDVVIRAKVHYGKLIKIITALVIIGVLGSLLVFTPFIQVLKMATPELKLFALLLALFMTLLYFVNIRRGAKLEVEKQIYRAIFFVISVTLYVFILVAANESYGSYVNFVNSQLINPAVQKFEASAEDKKREELLAVFRQKYLGGECEPIDYTEREKEGTITNFLYITTDPGLAKGGLYDPSDPTAYLKGHSCFDSENTFLLTEQGAWYWVTEESLEVISN